MCCSKLRLWSETCFSRTIQVVMEPYLTHLGMLCKFSFTHRWTNAKCILFVGFAFRDNQDMNFSRLPSFFIGSLARFGETIRSRSFTVSLKPGFQIKCEDYLSERNHISRKLPPEIFNYCGVECVGNFCGRWDYQGVSLASYVQIDLRNEKNSLNWAPSSIPKSLSSCMLRWGKRNLILPG